MTCLDAWNLNSQFQMLEEVKVFEADSDSDPFDLNESSLVEESYSDSLSSVDEILESKEKKNPRTVKWSKEDTADLKSHFRKYIFTQKDNNTGNLPCKKESKDFLKTNNISSLFCLGLECRDVIG
ncbi:uncharacterized protein LOC128174786 [Crassostrea angulata]|uniref:uncharacterized protein LOC128174786 n=1 Tax=Magallana angulata TaxID=2784310 RepID=UPI0022B17A9F|nr:uncharacterized protein LOC128174786 [Crassostrea angulata]